MQKGKGHDKSILMKALLLSSYVRTYKYKFQILTRAHVFSSFTYMATYDTWVREVHLFLCMANPHASIYTYICSGLISTSACQLKSAIGKVRFIGSWVFISILIPLVVHTLILHHYFIPINSIASQNCIGIYVS